MKATINTRPTQDSEDAPDLVSMVAETKYTLPKTGDIDRDGRRYGPNQNYQLGSGLLEGIPKAISNIYKMANEVVNEGIIQPAIRDLNKGYPDRDPDQVLPNLYNAINKKIINPIVNTLNKGYSDRPVR